MNSNFFFTKNFYLGYEHYELRLKNGENYGEIFQPFSLHMHEIIELGTCHHTLRMTGLCIGNFLDYFQEGLKHIQPTKPNINTLYREYHSYLVHGNSSNNPITRKICLAIPSPLVKTVSSKAYHSLLKPFFEGLEEARKECIDYKENGFCQFTHKSSELVDYLLLISPKRIKIRVKEVAKRVQFITPSQSATLRAATKTSYSSHIPKISTFNEPITEDKFFPLEKISDLIESADSHLHSCLFALISATGERESEADQTLWQDIDFSSREIFAVDPELRDTPSLAYKGLSEREIKRLEWKGRGTPLTILLEPYGTLFFHHLALYMKYEYNPHCGHNFIFHNKNNRPLFLCDYTSAILDPFRSAAKKALGKDFYLLRHLGPHSLRHSFIFYLRNYLEHSNGQGLSDHELLMITGHQDIRSLQKYGKIDRELLLEKISHANYLRKSGNTPSSTQFQIKYLEERLAAFKEKLANF